MNNTKPEPIKITIEGGFRPDKTIQLTLGPDSDIEDWIETFKTILLHQTFGEDTIKELFETSENKEWNEWACDLEYDNHDLEDRDDINISWKSPKNNWKTEF